MPLCRSLFLGSRILAESSIIPYYLEHCMYTHGVGFLLLYVFDKAYTSTGWMRNALLYLSIAFKTFINLNEHTKLRAMTNLVCALSMHVSYVHRY